MDNPRISISNGSQLDDHMETHTEMVPKIGELMKASVKGEASDIMIFRRNDPLHQALVLTADAAALCSLP